MKATINLTEKELELLIQVIENCGWDGIQSPYDDLYIMLTGLRVTFTKDTDY